jgi:hypothetical protein
MPFPFKINDHDSAHPTDSRVPTLRSRHDDLSAKTSAHGATIGAFDSP